MTTSPTFDAMIHALVEHQGEVNERVAWVDVVAIVQICAEVADNLANPLDDETSERIKAQIAALVRHRVEPPFEMTGYVRDGGGGEVAIVVDRDTESYPEIGMHVRVTEIR